MSELSYDLVFLKKIPRYRGGKDGRFAPLDPCKPQLNP